VTAAIEIKDLVKVYRQPGTFWAPSRDVRAVDGVSLTVEPGQIYGFLGKNGAGKTTTLKMILGLTRPTSGTIRVFGEDAASPHVRRRIGFAPEQVGFYEHLTACETLEFLGRLGRTPDHELAARIPKLLELVNLENDGNKLVATFSKGMRQRLGLAQALLSEPELLLFDEPVTGLDPFGRRLFKDLLLKLKVQGKTVFHSSHHLLDVQEVCDQIGIIHCGKLILESKLADFAGRGKTLEEEFVDLVSRTDQEAGRRTTVD
jgi:ABC-2 type transport system ATP-binding protein